MANTTVSQEGWNYQPVDEVMRVWAAANGCSNEKVIKRWVTPEDGYQSMYCVEFGECGADVHVVRCSYNLAHHWPGYNTKGGTGARMAWDFMRAHPKKHTATSKRWAEVEARMRNH